MYLNLKAGIRLQLFLVDFVHRPCLISMGYLQC